MISEKSIKSSDQENLHLAARAMGFTLEDEYDLQGEYWPWVVELHEVWNPLYRSEDAFNLMVELKIDVAFWDEFVGADTFHTRSVHKEMYADDRLAAARRAIVKAAAEIGREMK